MKKVGLLTLSALLFFSYSPGSFACSCSDDVGSYLGNLRQAKKEETVSNTPATPTSTMASTVAPAEKFNPLIVFAEVLSTENEKTAKIQIKKLINGKLDLTTVELVTGDGGDCAIDTNIFEKGDFQVFNLSPYYEPEPEVSLPEGETEVAETPVATPDKPRVAVPGKFQVEACGIEMLDVEKKQGTFVVQGPLNKTEEELLQAKFGDKLEEMMDKWAQEDEKEYETIETKFESGLTKLFKTAYGNSWKEKFEAYMEEGDEKLVEPFKKDFQVLKTKRDMAIIKIGKEYQKRILKHLEEMKLDLFIQEVQKILG